MKNVLTLSLIICVILFSCFTEKPTKSEKLTSEHLSQADYEDLLDKITSGHIDEKQAKQVVSKLHSGKSYINALDELSPKSNDSQVSNNELNEVIERLDKIERNIEVITLYLSIKIDDKGRIIKLPTD